MSDSETFSLSKVDGAAQGLERSAHGVAKIRLAFGLVVIGALLLAAVFAEQLAPQDPTLDDLFLLNMPPAWLNADAASDFGVDNPWAYPLGTDSLGRDVASRLIYGARIAVIVGFSAACLAALFGLILGALAGFYGGWVDSVIRRVIDVWLAFPPVLLSIILIALLGTNLVSVIIVIAVIDWTRFARVVRADVLQQRRRDYIDAARITGGRDIMILIREVLPNILPLLVTLFFLEVGIAIIVETILSFVSLSVSSGAATWGDMIAEGRRILHEAWWVMAFPVAALVLTILGLNALGDGLRYYLDPVLRR